jgi:lipopolysaccharide export system permease protein
MWIIDRYLLRQFFQTFVVFYLSLTGLYIVFDVFTNLDEFLRAGEKSGGLLPLMASFYGYQALAFFDRTSALLALLSAAFTLAWVQRHNELLALMAAGISRLRAATPVIAAAVGITVLATFNRELVIPSFRVELSRRPQDLLGDVGQDLRPCYDNQTEILISGGATYRDCQRIAGPKFLLPPAISQHGKQIVAQNAYYLPPQGERPGGYLLEAVQEPKNLLRQPSLYLADRPVILTPHDYPDWLQSDQCFVVSEVTFEHLTGGVSFRQFASTAQLIGALRNPSMNYGADLRVAVHARFVQPFLDVSLLFLGLPLVIARHSRNIFVAIGLCLAVVTAFTLTVIGAHSLGMACLIDPALAAWAPLMLFGPAAVAMAEELWD